MKDEEYQENYICLANAIVKNALNDLGYWYQRYLKNKSEKNRNHVLSNLSWLYDEKFQILMMGGDTNYLVKEVIKNAKEEFEEAGKVTYSINTVSRRPYKKKIVKKNPESKWKEFRLNNKHNIRDVGKIIGVSHTTIRNFEIGRCRKLKKETIDKLKKYYPITKDEEEQFLWDRTKKGRKWKKSILPEDEKEERLEDEH